MTNMTLSISLFAFSLFLASWWLTDQLIVFAHKRSLVDQVNERSSHQTPTPRIGGLGFIGIIAMGICAVALFPNLNPVSLTSTALLGIFLPAFMVAVIGLLDDIYGLGRKLRFLGYLIASGLGVYFLGFHEATPSLTACILAPVLVILFCWHINLFNFMDGIDGIAASQAIFVLFGLYILSPQLDIIPLLLCMPLLGFLMLNWQPAAIFMGDAGSTFLGAVISSLLIHACILGDIHWTSALILSGAFWVDASWTLGYRLVTKQRWYAPHRSHAYQILSRKLRSHQFATLAYLAINLCWLLPLACLAESTNDYRFLILAVSVLPLGVGCFIIGAGNQAR